MCDPRVAMWEICCPWRPSAIHPLPPKIERTPPTSLTHQQCQTFLSNDSNHNAYHENRLGHIASQFSTTSTAVLRSPPNLMTGTRSDRNIFLHRQMYIATRISTSFVPPHASARRARPFMAWTAARSQFTDTSHTWKARPLFGLLQQCYTNSTVSAFSSSAECSKIIL